MKRMTKILFTRAFTHLLLFLETYQRAHSAAYDSSIALDGVMGDGYAYILRGLKILLQGELGSHEGVKLSSQIETLAIKAGFNPDTLEPM